jgi:hypothetical protein
MLGCTAATTLPEMYGTAHLSENEQDFLLAIGGRDEYQLKYDLKQGKKLTNIPRLRATFHAEWIVSW